MDKHYEEQKESLREPPKELAGYLEIIGAREVEFQYIPIYLYNKNDILRLRKAEGLTIEEVSQRIKDRKNTPQQKALADQ